MAELLVDDGDLVVKLTLGEKVWGLSRDIRVPFTAVRSISVPAYKWMALRGWRMTGVRVTGRFSYGTFRHGAGYDFGIIHRQGDALQIDVGTGRFSRLVVSVPETVDAQAEADRLADSAGIARSKPSKTD
jgi:hypothetical protein